MKAALGPLVAFAAWATPGIAHAQSQPPAAAAETLAERPLPSPGYILYRSQRRMSLVFRREMSRAEEQAAMDKGARLTPDEIMLGVDRSTSAVDVPGTYVYLVEARAGSYVLYGERDLNGDEPVGVCLCMGSIRFDVDAGEIVDLGTITFPGLEAANARPTERQAMTNAMENSIVLVPPQPGMAPPAIVGERPVRPVRLRAADKQDNIYGLYIDRHPAIPGILRYERDRVIDDQTGGEPAPQP